MHQYSNNILFRPLIFSVFIIGLLNFLAIRFYLFWSTTWFDMIMHFLGGFFIGLVVLYLKSFSRNPKGSYLKNLIEVIFFVIIIGTLWEVFELIIRATDMTDSIYFSDTRMDYVMDLFGGLVSVWFAEYKYKNNG